MSIAAIQWVLAESPTTGADRLLLLILAEAAHADGTGICVGPTELARRANVKNVRSVKRTLASLVRRGAIVPGPIDERYRTRVYTIALTSGQNATVGDSPPWSAGRKGSGRNGSKGSGRNAPLTKSINQTPNPARTHVSAFGPPGRADDGEFISEDNDQEQAA
ncbi:hypothetical protein FSW04_16220 [Baekduia soli]|uniref:Helix-turn-helix domain-containing protein n=1 Tax=Baekduia soli TaxID=496014 RepID=A0A5B8U7R2_9ACTN|nr:hypothetical protein [Baekduia soli]QEC48965.1 hypothetical protein FSW04_16220 [Baekduia soli]